jgi:two-component system cell cycle sensor histidine kinase/response regulator CckA
VRGRSRLLAWLHFRRKPPRLIDLLARQGEAVADEMVRLLFHEAPIAALAVGRDGRIVCANEVLRQLIGAGVDLSPGAPAEAIFPPEERTATWRSVAQAFATPPRLPRDFVVALDGAAVASVSVLPLREADGTVSGAILRLTDLSRLRQLEAQLAQSQRLQAVGQLTGGIAHDFNNLLTAVIGAADSIAARDGLDAETRDDAAQIHTSVMRGAALVRQLLAFGRQQTLRPRVLSVNGVITDVSLLLRRLLGERVRLELELETPGRMVRADPTQLDQVLVNLAVNARDAMPDGGVLTLRTGHLTLLQPTVRGPDTILPGRYVMIEVRDTGAGIAPEVLPHIFEPFFTTRRERGGSGLGLATVHGIVRQSDGYLTVESEVEAGTCMRVYLPRWDDHELDVPATAPVVAGAVAAPVRADAPRAVLLVEDEEPVRRLAERTLARQGWQVLAAESGEAALALLDAGTPDMLAAIVTDMVMPGMDGIAVVRAVRERLGNPGLPAILVSGYAEAALRRDLESVATTFMAKPYTLKEMVAKLEAEVAQAAGTNPSRFPVPQGEGKASA